MILAPLSQAETLKQLVTQGITVYDNLRWLPNGNSMMQCSLDMQNNDALAAATKSAGCNHW